jgi:hypothetical protein
LLHQFDHRQQELPVGLGESGHGVRGPFGISVSDLICFLHGGWLLWELRFGDTILSSRQPPFQPSTIGGTPSDKAADLLYEVINRRYERKPLVITTNKAFQEWNEVFPNATCLGTLLDRLIHHADVTVLEGKSYRLRESELETAACVRYSELAHP